MPKAELRALLPEGGGGVEDPRSGTGGDASANSIYFIFGPFHKTFKSNKACSLFYEQAPAVLSIPALQRWGLGWEDRGRAGCPQEGWMDTGTGLRRHPGAPGQPPRKAVPRGLIPTCPVQQCVGMASWKGAPEAPRSPLGHPSPGLRMCRGGCCGQNAASPTGSMQLPQSAQRRRCPQGPARDWSAARTASPAHRESLGGACWSSQNVSRKED